MNITLKQAHTQWATRPADQRFQTLEDLIAKVNGRRMRSRSQDYGIRDTRIVVDGDNLAIMNKNLRAEPSHWSFGQFSSKVGAPASYLRTLPANLAADCLNLGIERAGDEQVKLMSLVGEEDEGTILQAVTSPTYGRIWDADVARHVGNLVEATGGRFHNPKAYAHKGDKADGFKTLDMTRTEPSGLYASDHDVFIFMIDGGSILDAGPRAQINRGFFVSNSEVGAKTFTLTTFLFNFVCGNHFVWGAHDINTLKIVHRSGAPERFVRDAQPALLDYVNASAAPLETAIRKAQDYLIPMKAEKRTFDDVVAFANQHSKFTKAEIREAYDYANREEGDCATLWQLAQGFTAFARGFEFIDARVDLETRAGNLLNLVKE